MFCQENKDKTREKTLAALWKELAEEKKKGFYLLALQKTLANIRKIHKRQIRLNEVPYPPRSGKEVFSDFIKDGDTINEDAREVLVAFEALEKAIFAFKTQLAKVEKKRKLFL